jgi:menaquinone-dependent protoporphyrinogen oxidase
MKVLVAYASRYGSTRGIAERIAQCLRVAGQQAEARPVQEGIDDLGGYDAFVVGSAVFAGHWMAEATGFVRRHRAVLASRPTWLFSSGPIGTMAAKHEPVAPKETGELVRAIGAREHRVFFGAWDRANADRAKLGFAERMVARWLPEGDFRDWATIEGWADSIARALQGARIAPR